MTQTRFPPNGFGVESRQKVGAGDLPASVVTVATGAPSAGQVPVFTGTGNQTAPGSAGTGATPLSDAAFASVGVADREKSLQAQAIEYADGTGWEEDWASLASWTVWTGTAQVSGGKLFSNPLAGLTRPLLLPAGGRARIRCKFYVPAAGTGYPDPTGIGVKLSGGSYNFLAVSPGNLQNSFGVAATNGSFPTSPLPAGTYSMTVTTDEYVTSFSLLSADHSIEWVSWCEIPTGQHVTDVAIFVEDPRSAAGIGIGPVVAKTLGATVTPRASFEDVDSVVWTDPLVSGYTGMRIALPAAYDSRKALPVVMYHHGYTGDENSMFTDTHGTTLIQTLINAGFIVVSCNAGAVGNTPNSGNNWGNQAALDQYVTLYQYVRDHVSMGPMVLLGISMGGLSSLLTLAQRRVPNIYGWAGIYPIANLASAYAETGFDPSINGSYNIPGGGNYATQTAGHDPVLLPNLATALRGVGLRFYASPSDTVAIKTANSDVVSAAVGTTARENTIVVCSGDHGDPSHYQPSDLLAFFQRCVTA